MPAWLEIPEDISREDLSVTLDFYTSGKAVFTLYRKQGYAVLDRVVARVRDKTPLEKDGTSWPMGALPEYPLYVVVTFNGISEIVEKKKDGPVIHITDEKGVIVSLGCIQDTDGGYDCSVD